MVSLVLKTLEYQSIVQKSAGILGLPYITNVSFVEKILKQPKVSINNIVATNVETTHIKVKMQQLGKVKTLVIQQFTNGLPQLMENLLNVSNVVVKVILTGLTRVGSILGIIETIGYTYAGNATFTTTGETKYLRDIRKRYAKFIGKGDEWEQITKPL